GGAVALHVQGHGLAHAPGRVLESDVLGREVIALHAHRGRGVGTMLFGIARVVAVGDDDALPALAKQRNVGFLRRNQQLFPV
nr:hypothetical protein [Tanacetum cinerariifolium]